MRIQLWLWFIGTMVMTLPWHALGLFGQPRRVSTFDYAFPQIAWWAPWTLVSTAGGAIMFASALYFVWNLAMRYRGRAEQTTLAWAMRSQCLCRSDARCTERLCAVELARAVSDGCRVRVSDGSLHHRHPAAMIHPA